MENAARQNVQLEALVSLEVMSMHEIFECDSFQTNDNERLHAKMQASQIKIMELSRDNNKLREQIKILQSTQHQPGDSTDRIWKAMDTLNGWGAFGCTDFVCC